jgi:uncharacterized membrane protein
MTKQAFLDELQKRLTGLPKTELDNVLLYYGEMIDDLTDCGYTEALATAEFGSTDAIADQILSHYPLSKIVKEKVRPKRRMKAWEIVLLILGAPIWIALMIAAASVVLAVYLAICVVVISLWVIGTTLEIASVIITAAGVFILIQGNLPTAAAVFGAGLVGVGVSVLIFFISKAATKGLRLLTQKTCFGIKKLLVGKEQLS